MGLITTHSTLAEAQRVAASIGKLLSYPQKGSVLRPGSRAVIPDTWDGQGRRPVGWTSTACSIQQHPDRVEFAVKAPAATDAAIADARSTRLTTQERTELQTARAGAVDLVSWLASAAAESVKG